MQHARAQVNVTPRQPVSSAHETKLVRLDRVRADTTVVEANVAYPTDSGLLAKGVAKIAKLTCQLKAAGLATRTRDRTLSVRRRAHLIAAWLCRRNDNAKAEVKAINVEMAAIAAHPRRVGPDRVAA
jgi:IS5 family transposase